jgi:hypothetical protein
VLTRKLKGTYVRVSRRIKFVSLTKSNDQHRGCVVLSCLCPNCHMHAASMATTLRHRWREGERAHQDGGKLNAREQGDVTIPCQRKYQLGLASGRRGMRLGEVAVRTTRV